MLHDPPGVASVKIIVEPVHTDVGPLMAAGAGLTFKSEVTLPPPSVYVIIVVPAAIAATTPVLKPTVATEVLLLLQVPPALASENV